MQLNDIILAAGLNSRATSSILSARRSAEAHGDRAPSSSESFANNKGRS